MNKNNLDKLKLFNEAIFDFQNDKKFASIRNIAGKRSKIVDKILFQAYEIKKDEYFGDFMPNEEQIPLCVIAGGNYALCEISSNITFAIIYKNQKAYNIKEFAHAFGDTLKQSSLHISMEIYELNEISKNIKDNFKLRDKFSFVRFVFGSKKLYKSIKNELSKLQNYKNDEFISFNFANFSPLDNSKFLSLSPNLNDGYGGFCEYRRIFCLLENLGGFKNNALKFLSVDEFSNFKLSADFVISLHSILYLESKKDNLTSVDLKKISSLLNIKGKKLLDSETLLLNKTLMAMQDVSLYSRYLLRCVFRKQIFTFSQNKSCKYGKFYIINDTVHCGLHVEHMSLIDILKNLNFLPDKPLKFGVEIIVLFKRANSGEISDKDLNEFKKIFLKANSFGILKALLDGDLLFSLIKPLEYTKYVPDIYEISIDDLSLKCIYEIENLKDESLKNIYDNLSHEAKMVLKLAALMHAVAINQSDNHEVMASNIFRAYANKLKLNHKTIELGVNVIKNQNLLNNTSDILSIISNATSKESLDLIYIFSYALAHSSQYYGTNTAQNFTKLYHEAIKDFEIDENLLDLATKRSKKEALIKKQFIHLKNDLDIILNIKSDLFMILYPANLIVKIALWAKDCANIALKPNNEDEFCIEMIVKQGWNMVMVLNKLNHLDLEYMEIYELFDDKFFAKLKYSKKADQNEIKSMQNMIISALCDKTKPNLTKPEIKQNEFKFEPSYSQNYAKITINAKNQRGFMAFILSIFEKFDLKVANARIQTIKNRTRNLFLVEKTQNLEEIFNQIQKNLI